MPAGNPVPLQLPQLHACCAACRSTLWPRDDPHSHQPTSMLPMLQAALRRAVLQVPGDVLVALMELLSPADRDSRAGLVSKAWLEAAMDPCHWGGLVEHQVSEGAVVVVGLCGVW